MVGPVPPGTRNDNFSTVRPFTVAAFPALVEFVAVGTVPSEDSTMLVPVMAS